MTSMNKAAALIGRVGPKLAHNAMTSRGGEPEYTWQEIMGAMAGLPKHQYSLLLMAFKRGAREKLPPSEVTPVFQRAHAELSAMPEVQQWREAPGGSLERLIETAIEEHVSPSTRLCRACSGRGEVLPELIAPNVIYLTFSCGDCAGSGRRQLTWDVLASKLGLQKTAREKVWRGRYALVYNFIGEWLIAGLRHVSKRM